MSEDFNLHALAIQVVRESMSPDPGVMAKELVARLEPSEYEGALHLMARAYVRRVFAETRWAATQSGGSASSAKVAGIRESWRRMRAVGTTSPESLSTVVR